MDDPEDARFTLSFDLLFKGLEITTGGQRIHDYNMLVQKIEDRGMTQEGMEQYLDTFKHGMPPHGGLGIGLERLTMQLIGEENVRETCLFPRDMNRLETVNKSETWKAAYILTGKRQVDSGQKEIKAI